MDRRHQLRVKKDILEAFGKIELSVVISDPFLNRYLVAEMLEHLLGRFVVDSRK